MKQRSRVLPALVGLLLLGGFACGPNEQPPARQRLDLLMSGARPEGSATRRLVPAEQPEAWDYDAPGLEMAGSDQPEPMVVLGAGRSEQALTILYRGALDLGGVGQLRVRARFKGRGQLRAELLNAGEVRARLGPLELMPSSTLRDYDLALHDQLREPLEVDGIRLLCEGGARRLAFAELQLVPEFDLAALPDSEQGARPVLVGRGWRPAVGLVSGQELTARIAPAEDSVLRFAAGLPSRLSRPGQGEPDALRIDLEANGEALDQRLVPIEVGSKAEREWHDLHWNLGRFAGRGELTLRFRLQAAGPGRLAACALTVPLLVRPRADAPRVLLITSDTHRADHLGLLGGAVRVDTPNLDQLAARGELFSDCFSTTNVTGPAHQAILTGQHPRDLRPILNGIVLDESVPTLAEHFAAAGYDTLAVVSAKHLGPRFSGLGRGFQRFDRPDGAQRRSALGVAVLQSWLDELPGEPVFAWLHLFDAHAPYDPPREFDRRYYPAERDPWASDWGHPGAIAPRDMPGLRDMSYARAQYAAEVTALDASLAGLLDRPDLRSGVIAFVGDHGEGLGQHHVFFGHAELYPETLAVPLILDWPGAEPGRRRDRPVSSRDLGATLLDLAGLERGGFPGHDLRVVPSHPEPRLCVSSGGDSAAIVEGPWFLVLHLVEHGTLHTVERYARHEVELYDLSTDRGCERNLVASQPERASDLRARLIAWLSQARPPAGSASRADESLSLLTQLGYVGEQAERVDGLWQADHCERCLPFESGER